MAPLTDTWADAVPVDMFTSVPHKNDCERVTLWQRALDVPLGKGCYATLTLSLARKRGWPKLLTFAERRKWNCRMWAASTWWPPLPWSHVELN